MEKKANGPHDYWSFDEQDNPRPAGISSAAARRRNLCSKMRGTVCSYGPAKVFQADLGQVNSGLPFMRGIVSDIQVAIPYPHARVAGVTTTWEQQQSPELTCRVRDQQAGACPSPFRETSGAGHQGPVWRPDKMRPAQFMACRGIPNPDRDKRWSLKDRRFPPLPGAP